jgi:NAD(P)-dependent dehydrogenase (short-subunit alcohol dehydrogenase family)
MSSAIVIGAGPGIGASLVRRFSREGLAVGAIARSRAAVESVAEAYGVTADVTDEDGLRAALDEIVKRLGVPEVLVYNAALVRRDRIDELTAGQHLDAWAVNVVGAITAAAHLAPRMVEAGGGTILFTGGMPEPLPEKTSLSLGKAGGRALAHLLATQFGPSGIHVATVTVGGAVAARTAFDPDAIADEYWRLHTQAEGAWELDVSYNPSD